MTREVVWTDSNTVAQETLKQTASVYITFKAKNTHARIHTAGVCAACPVQTRPAGTCIGADSLELGCHSH